MAFGVIFMAGSAKRAAGVELWQDVVGVAALAEAADSAAA